MFGYILFVIKCIIMYICTMPTRCVAYLQFMAATGNGTASDIITAEIKILELTFTGIAYNACVTKQMRVLVDISCRTKHGMSLPEGTFWINKARASILNPKVYTTARAQLAKLTASHVALSLYMSKTIDHKEAVERLSNINHWVYKRTSAVLSTDHPLDISDVVDSNRGKFNEFVERLEIRI